MSILYLFSDGGGFPHPKRKFDSGRSFRLWEFVEENGRLLNAPVIIEKSTTGQYAEVFGMTDGIRSAFEYIEACKEEDRPEKIKIYLDSMFCFMGMTAWIYSWMARARKGIWYSTKGPVAHQDGFKQSYSDISKLTFKKVVIEFYHINSHVTKSNLAQLKIKFEEFNKVKISDEEFAFIHAQNDECDKAITAGYKEFVKMNQAVNTNISEKN